MVDIPFERDAETNPPESMLPESSTRTAGDDDLDRLAREWLTVMLLDLGIRSFEDWLETLENRVGSMVEQVFRQLAQHSHGHDQLRRNGSGRRGLPDRSK